MDGFVELPTPAKLATLPSAAQFQNGPVVEPIKYLRVALPKIIIEMDSPADDLRATDLNSRFYDYLASSHPERQFIIVENTDPPPGIRANEQAVLFSGFRNDDTRFGLFPLSAVDDEIGDTA